MARTEVTTRFQVNVIGQAWGGFESTYTYEFEKFPTLQDVRSKAGDFESVDDYEVIKSTTTFTPTPKGYKRTDEFETVQKFSAVSPQASETR